MIKWTDPKEAEIPSEDDSGTEVDEIEAVATGEGVASIAAGIAVLAGGGVGAVGELIAPKALHARVVRKKMQRTMWIFFMVSYLVN